MKKTWAFSSNSPEGVGRDRQTNKNTKHWGLSKGMFWILWGHKGRGFLTASIQEILAVCLPHVRHWAGCPLVDFFTVQAWCKSLDSAFGSFIGTFSVLAIEYLCVLDNIHDWSICDVAFLYSFRMIVLCQWCCSEAHKQTRESTC